METATQPKFITCRNCDTVHSGDKWAGSDCAKGRCVSPLPAPQETPAQQGLLPCPWCKQVPRPSNGEFVVFHTVSCFLGIYTGAPTRGFIHPNKVKAWNTRYHDPAFQKLVEVARQVEAWLTIRKDLTGRLQAAGDTRIASISSREIEILDQVREALRLAREGE